MSCCMVDEEGKLQLNGYYEMTENDDTTHLCEWRLLAVTWSYKFETYSTFQLRFYSNKLLK